MEQRATAEPAISKTIARFDPVSSRSPAECERHYAEVHTPYARRLLRDVDDVATYHTARAVAQYDITGGWRAKPAAWRFVVLRFPAGRGLRLPPQTREVIAQDHRNFLRDLRTCVVEERLLVDRRSGQTQHEHYLIELDRHPDADPGAAVRRVEGMVQGLLSEQSAAYGIRLVVLNMVQAELAAAAIDEPGQRSLGQPLPQTCKVAYLDFAFDHREWAEEWFARPAVRSLVQDPWFAVARGYRLEVESAIDKR